MKAVPQLSSLDVIEVRFQSARAVWGLRGNDSERYDTVKFYRWFYKDADDIMENGEFITIGSVGTANLTKSGGITHTKIRS